MTTVRMATKEDAAALIQLNALFNGVQGDEQRVKDSLQHSAELVAVAVKGDAVVGFACAQYAHSFCYPEPQGEITEMYIREEDRRNGCALELICCLEAELRERGAESVKILTNTGNEPAKQAYLKAGYTITNETVMTKSIKKTL